MPDPSTRQGEQSHRDGQAHYGGQAVIEGVMIRGQSSMATACRLPNQEIVVHSEPVRPLSQRSRWLRLPFVRGTPALIDALVMGFRSLFYSADVQLEYEKKAAEQAET